MTISKDGENFENGAEKNFLMFWTLDLRISFFVRISWHADFGLGDCCAHVYMLMRSYMHTITLLYA
jgi:hypothetical protein